MSAYFSELAERAHHYSMCLHPGASIDNDTDGHYVRPFMAWLPAALQARGMYLVPAPRGWLVKSEVE